MRLRDNIAKLPRLTKSYQDPFISQPLLATENLSSKELEDEEKFALLRRRGKLPVTVSVVAPVRNAKKFATDVRTRFQSTKRNMIGYHHQEHRESRDEEERLLNDSFEDLEAFTLEHLEIEQRESYEEVFYLEVVDFGGFNHIKSHDSSVDDTVGTSKTSTSLDSVGSEKVHDVVERSYSNCETHTMMNASSALSLTKSQNELETDLERIDRHGSVLTDLANEEIPMTCSFKSIIDFDEPLEPKALDSKNAIVSSANVISSTDHLEKKSPETNETFDDSSQSKTTTSENANKYSQGGTTRMLSVLNNQGSLLTPQHAHSSSYSGSGDMKPSKEAQSDNDMLKMKNNYLGIEMCESNVVLTQTESKVFHSDELHQRKMNAFGDKNVVRNPVMVPIPTSVNEMEGQDPDLPELNESAGSLSLSCDESTAIGTNDYQSHEWVEMKGINNHEAKAGPALSYVDTIKSLLFNKNIGSDERVNTFLSSDAVQREHSCVKSQYSFTSNSPTLFGLNISLESNLDVSKEDDSEPQSTERSDDLSYSKRDNITDSSSCEEGLENPVEISDIHEEQEVVEVSTTLNLRNLSETNTSNSIPERKSFIDRTSIKEQELSNLDNSYETMISNALFPKADVIPPGKREFLISDRPIIVTTVQHGDVILLGEKPLFESTIGIDEDIKDVQDSQVDFEQIFEENLGDLIHNRQKIEQQKFTKEGDHNLGFINDESDVESLSSRQELVTKIQGINDSNKMVTQVEHQDECSEIQDSCMQLELPNEDKSCIRQREHANYENSKKIIINEQSSITNAVNQAVLHENEGNEFIACNDWVLSDDDSVSFCSQPFGSFTINEDVKRAILDESIASKSTSDQQLSLESICTIKQPSQSACNRTVILADTAEMRNVNIGNNFKSSELGSFNFCASAVNKVVNSFTLSDSESTVGSDTSSDSSEGFFDCHSISPRYESFDAKYTEESEIITSKNTRKSNFVSTLSDNMIATQPELVETSDDDEPCDNSCEIDEAYSNLSLSDDEGKHFDSLITFWIEEWIEMTGDETCERLVQPQITRTTNLDTDIIHFHPDNYIVNMDEFTCHEEEIQLLMYGCQLETVKEGASGDETASKSSENDSGNPVTNDVVDENDDMAVISHFESQHQPSSLFVFHSSRTSRKRYLQVKKRTTFHAKAKMQSKYSLDYLKLGYQGYFGSKKNGNQNKSVASSEVKNALDKALAVLSKQDNVVTNVIKENDTIDILMNALCSKQKEEINLKTSTSEFCFDHLGQLENFINSNQSKAKELFTLDNIDIDSSSGNSIEVTNRVSTEVDEGQEKPFNNSNIITSDGGDSSCNICCEVTNQKNKQHPHKNIFSVTSSCETKTDESSPMIEANIEVESQKLKDYEGSVACTNHVNVNSNVHESSKSDSEIKHVGIVHNLSNKEPMFSLNSVHETSIKRANKVNYNLQLEHSCSLKICHSDDVIVSRDQEYCTIADLEARNERNDQGFLHGEPILSVQSFPETDKDGSKADEMKNDLQLQHSIGPSLFKSKHCSTAKSRGGKEEEKNHDNSDEEFTLPFVEYSHESNQDGYDSIKNTHKLDHMILFTQSNYIESCNYEEGAKHTSQEYCIDSSLVKNLCTKENASLNTIKKTNIEGCIIHSCSKDLCKDNDRSNSKDRDGYCEAKIQECFEDFLNEENHAHTPEVEKARYSCFTEGHFDDDTIHQFEAPIRHLDVKNFPDCPEDDKDKLDPTRKVVMVNVDKVERYKKNENEQSVIGYDNDTQPLKLGSLTQKLYFENAELAEILASTQSDLVIAIQKLESMTSERNKMIETIGKLMHAPKLNLHPDQVDIRDFLEWYECDEENVAKLI